MQVKGRRHERSIRAAFTVYSPLPSLVRLVALLLVTSFRIMRRRPKGGEGVGERNPQGTEAVTMKDSVSLPLPLLSLPYNHFQAFQSSTVVTEYGGAETESRMRADKRRDRPLQTLRDEDHHKGTESRGY